MLVGVRTEVTESVSQLGVGAERRGVAFKYEAATSLKYTQFHVRCAILPYS